ncbi:MAG: helix-turn-helix transcriptional regulator [Pseudolabrys sp.]|jgi:transcriptional regulator with XRE-family HTH domain
MTLETDHNRLGAYLRDRRARLDPAAFGLPLTRRRTPGLRREEVAQRAHVSATWYTWLEQGRGGAPSADALDRIAGALMLTRAEREHLFLLGLGRPPEVRYQASEGVSPRLQKVLDALELNPAIVKTATWDVVAWNKAAAAVLTDYSKLPADKRNILRIIFGDPRSRARQSNWENVARFVVAAFRADAARLGASDTVKALVAELGAQSPEFAAMWREHDVRHFGEGTKRLELAGGGTIGLEFSSFAVDGRPDLGLIVYSPATPKDADKIRALVKDLHKETKSPSFRGAAKRRARTP